MAKKALTEADIAALAAGATLDAETHTETATEGANDGLQAETTTEAEVTTQSETVAETVVTVDASVQFMQNMVKEKDDAILAANLKISKLEERLSDIEAAHTPLLQIAIKSVSNMTTAMNGTSLLSEGMAAVQVLAEHQRVTELFTKKFPIGGVAAVSSDDAQTKTQIDPRRQARVNAVRFHK